MTTAANSAPVDLSPVLGSASGIGLATFDGEQVLDVWYPAPCLGSDAIDVSGQWPGPPGLDVDVTGAIPAFAGMYLNRTIYKRGYVCFGCVLI